MLRNKKIISIIWKWEYTDWGFPNMRKYIFLLRHNLCVWTSLRLLMKRQPDQACTSEGPWETVTIWIRLLSPLFVCFCFCLFLLLPFLETFSKHIKQTKLTTELLCMKTRKETRNETPDLGNRFWFTNLLLRSLDSSRQDPARTIALVPQPTRQDVSRRARGS